MAVMPQSSRTISGGIVALGAGTNTPIPNAGAPSAGTNAVQTISASGTVSGGTYRIGIGGVYTSALAFGALAATVQTALNTAFGSGAATAGGGPLPGTAMTVTYGAGLGAMPVALLTIDNSALTGGGSYVVANTTAGVAASGRGAANGALMRDVTAGTTYKNTATPPAAPVWGSPVALEAEEEPEEEETTGKKRSKSVKGPPEDKAGHKDEEKDKGGTDDPTR